MFPHMVAVVIDHVEFVYPLAHASHSSYSRLDTYKTKRIEPEPSSDKEIVLNRIGWCPTRSKESTAVKDGRSLLHCGTAIRRMSALGQHQTKRHRAALSALPPKADFDRCDGNVRLVPKADIRMAENTPAIRSPGGG